MKRKEGSANPDPESDYTFQRRLVMCLDGTWNQRDSGTNIYHLSNLVLEGKIEPGSTPSDVGPTEDPVLQRRREGGSQEDLGPKRWSTTTKESEPEYPLDQATGGAFGIVLEENVRVTPMTG